MSLLNANPEISRAADEGAIAALARCFSAQKIAFAKDRNPSLAVRQERLQALIGMMATHRERISRAIAQDFGAHPAAASDLIETLGVMGRAAYVLENLEDWMRPSERHMDAALFGSARAEMQLQPKGVIGNIVPWNFPFDLSVGPMVEMLAAGNRVIVKPSEFTPACAALLQEMIAASFDPDLVTVVVGGLELAEAFSATPWDHLLYTGSPGVGRKVMAAAAANLTPVTLELGGKCPALMTPGAVTSRNVESVIGTKIIKNGQMCVSVDYALVPRDELEIFIAEAQGFMARAAPDYSRSAECAGIISAQHVDRLTGMLAEAAGQQVRIVTLEENTEVDAETRRMPMSLVIDPSPELALSREEIFGPILPVIAYDDLESAIEHINRGERPLALYVFGDDTETTNHVLAETHSGGAAVNTCAVQSALPSMGFGGSGMSGMGMHHGIEGFREFSNQRGVVVRGEGDLINAFYSPYATGAAVVEAALGG